MAKKWHYSFLSAACLFAIAVACQTIPSYQAGLVQVSPLASPYNQRAQIAQHLENTLGSTLQNVEVLVTYLSVRACAAGICGQTIMAFIKPCGETFGTAFQNSGFDGISTPGGGGGGGGVGGVGGGAAPWPRCIFNCGTVTIRD